jgi:hypothetical protein
MQTSLEVATKPTSALSKLKILKGLRMALNPALGSSQRNATLSILAALLFVGACALAVRADLAYNQTFDEAAHVACGMEWLSNKTYNIEVLHPPLGRVATAILPYWAGARLPKVMLAPDEDYHNLKWAIGTEILNWRGQYARNLLLCRLGMIAFFLFGACVVFFEMSRRYDALHACVAVVLYAFCPALLTYASQAMTDLPLAATYPLSVFSIAECFRRLSFKSSLIAAASLALACLTKFTEIPFFVCAVAILLVWRKLNNNPLLPAARAVILVGLMSLPLIWAGYRFSYAPILTNQTIHATSAKALDSMSPRMRLLFTEMKVPAPELMLGMVNVARLGGGAEGRIGYVLGEPYHGGRWYFFPVAILAKTTIPMLIFFGLGCFFLLRNKIMRATESTQVLLAGFAAPLITAIPSSINLGLRHILPLYPFMAMIAAVGAVTIWRTSRNVYVQLGIAVLLAYNVFACCLASPEFLPYFNEIAASHADYVLVGADLDHGQDLYKLERTLANHSSERVYLDYFGDPKILRHNSVSWGIMTPSIRPTGWVAISESALMAQRTEYGWIFKYPYTMVGRSIRLYHFTTPPV